MIRSFFIAWLLLLAFAVPSLGADSPAFPALTGRVVDEAGILPPQSVQRLTAELAAHEKRTGQQVVVAVVKSLGGRPIEDYGYQLGRFWGIGQKDKNTGALLLVAPAERKVRIEVGYGLEGDLTDAVSSVIINQTILPRFRKGDMAGGIVAGAEQVLRALGDQVGAPLPPPPRAAQAEADDGSGSVGSILISVVILVFVWLLRRRGGGFLPFFVASSWGGGGGGRSSGGGGGFSGGGGSFGGGGASGSW